MGYSKQETIKKQKQLVSKSQRNKRKILVNGFKIILVLLVTVIIACAGAGFGMIKGILDNAPDVNQINIMPRGFKTVIYDQDGNQMMEISTIDSNRVYVYYDEIPEDFVNAFVAIEDERFWTHNGIDVKGIFRAAFKGLASGNFDEGASTLTQQLIKNHVFNVGLNEVTFMDRLERKIQEQYLALELEQKYTKEQIVEYYLNTIYLGRGVHGIQAASQRYFGKDMTQLTISEIAAIAGITQNPSKYDPVVNPEDSAERRKLVLDKMLELDYITKQEYDTAMADDVYARIEAVYEIQKAEDDINTYYEDAIIDSLVEDFQELYGCTQEEASTMIFTGGYSVYSVQDEDIQEICDNVINNPEYLNDSTKVGLEYKLSILDSDGETEINYMTGHLLLYFREQTGNSKYNNIYANEEAARAAADEFKEAMLNKTDGTFIMEDFKVSPQPQFSFVIMDQHTGYVKAIVGGRGEKTTNRGLNRATDSPRQPGSTFKPLAAYLPYIDTNMGGLASPFKDEEYRYKNGGFVYNWWGSKYRGYVTVREAIAQSMNVIAVKTITAVNEEVAFEYLLDLGFTTVVEQRVESDGSVYSDITQSAALGGLTDGVTNLEITAAYAAIANGGVYTKPVFYSKVIDHDGNIVIDNTTPTTRIVMQPTTAWQLIDAMKSVVNSGTGTPCRMRTGVTCAGKTGTTSNNYDLWFCGMSPYYTASIWMGYDMNVDMGSSVPHKYMWRDIMDEIATLEGQDTSVDFERPEGITSVTLCKISGKLPEEGCPTCNDYIAANAIPGTKCTGHETVEICLDSKCVATDTCVNKVELVVDVNSNTHKNEFVDAPEGIVYTEEVCPLHPEGGMTFNVTTSAGEGGTISPSFSAKQGSTVTVYIVPYSGYQVSNVVVNGASVGAVQEYTISNLTSDTTISATFVKKAGGGSTDPVTPPSSEAPPSSETTTEMPPSSETTTEMPPSSETTTEPAATSEVTP